MVPHYAMPDADSATNSEAMNDHLATLLRRTVLRLRAAAAAGEDLEPIRAAALADVHRVLVIHLGAPPAEFVWQYRDRGKVFHRVGALTPVEFTRRYVSGLTGKNPERSSTRMPAPMTEQTRTSCITIASSQIAASFPMTMRQARTGALISAFQLEP